MRRQNAFYRIGDIFGLFFSSSRCDIFLSFAVLEYIYRNLDKAKDDKRKMKENDLTLLIDKEVLNVKIECEIDSHTVKSVRERIDECIFLSRPKLLVLDFSEVRFMDSSGLALIFGRLSLMESLGGAVRLDGVGSHLMKLLRLSGIERMSNITLSVQ